MRKRIDMRLPEPIVDAVDAIVESGGGTRTRVMELALSAYIDKLAPQNITEPAVPEIILTATEPASYDIAAEEMRKNREFADRVVEELGPKGPQEAFTTTASPIVPNQREVVIQRRRKMRGLSYNEKLEQYF